MPNLASITIKVENKNKLAKENELIDNIVRKNKFKSISISIIIKIIIIWNQFFIKVRKYTGTTVKVTKKI